MEQRIIEGAARLRPDGRTGVVTGWAGLRWRGAAFFDGRPPFGAGELPVELALGGTGARLTPLPGVIVNRRCLLPQDREIVVGLPVAAIQCCLFDEICRRSDLWSAVQVIDMAAAARLISVWLFATYVGACNSRNGAPLARHAVSLAVASPQAPGATSSGRGTRAAVPRSRTRVLRGRGGRQQGVAAARVHAGGRRAKFLPPESRAWTLERPPWDPAPETLDAYFERLGLVDALTRC